MSNKEYRSRYPLLLPRPDDMTPRWQKIVSRIKARPDIFTIKDIGDGFSMAYYNPSAELDNKITKMLQAMNVPPANVVDILDIDPIQTVPPALHSTWTGRGHKVCEIGIITLKFRSSNKVYQYPFIEVEQ